MTSSLISQVYNMHIRPSKRIDIKSLLSRLAPSPTAEEATNLQAWQQRHEPLIVASVQHVHEEIPIGLAKRIVDLEKLPYELPQALPVQRLKETLLLSFEQMVNFPLPTNLETQKQYMDLQMDVRKRHATMHNAIQQALTVIDPIHRPDDEDNRLKSLLDDFYHSRIGLRLLVDQHQQMLRPQQGYQGIIETKCNVRERVQQVIDATTQSFEQKMGAQAPVVHLHATDDVYIQYIPSHLSIVVSEMLKHAIRNSYNALIPSEALQNKNIHVTISGGASGICIRVSDEGGKLHFKQLEDTWCYLQQPASPADAQSRAYDPVASSYEDRAWISDSFGLPIARLYARYFGGELTIMPMEGFGTDTFLHLNHYVPEDVAQDIPSGVAV